MLDDKIVFSRRRFIQVDGIVILNFTLKGKQIRELATAVNYNINSTCEYAELLFSKLIMIIESR